MDSIAARLRTSIRSEPLAAPAVNALFLISSMVFAIVFTPLAWAGPTVTNVAVGMQSGSMMNGTTGSVTYQLVVTKGGAAAVR